MSPEAVSGRYARPAVPLARVHVVTYAYGRYEDTQDATWSTNMPRGYLRIRAVREHTRCHVVS
eukprot:5389719-Prymnesium_polylepis.1